jgi:hypothetical protein
MLSNNHIFANVNTGLIGDHVYQPGVADGASSGDEVGRLTRFVKIELGGQESNSVDAAICELLEGVAFRLEICGIGKVAGTVQAINPMEVRKHGRTTGYTEGDVFDVSYDTLIGVGYGGASGVALFKKQIRIHPRPPFTTFASGGDSGALLVEASSGAAVGLCCASPPSGEYGVANYITSVLAEMEIDLL